MSISMNSNEEISFVTPDSHAANKSSNKNLKNNLFVKRGAVPNTKLIFEDNDYEQISSPVLGQKSSENKTSSAHQNNPAIYKTFNNNFDNNRNSSSKKYSISELSVTPIEEKKQVIYHNF